MVTSKIQFGIQEKEITIQIPNSKLVELENSCHIFKTDQTEKSAEAILEFLEKLLQFK